MLLNRIDGSQQEVRPLHPHIVFVEPDQVGGSHNPHSKGIFVPQGILVDQYTGQLVDHRKDYPAVTGYIEDLPDDLTLVNQYGGLKVGDHVIFKKYAAFDEIIGYNWVAEFSDPTNPESPLVRVQVPIVPMHIDSIEAVIE